MPRWFRQRRLSLLGWQLFVPLCKRCACSQSLIRRTTCSWACDRRLHVGTYCSVTYVVCNFIRRASVMSLREQACVLQGQTRLIAREIVVVTPMMCVHTLPCPQNTCESLTVACNINFRASVMMEALAVPRIVMREQTLLIAFCTIRLRSVRRHRLRDVQ